MSFGAETYRVLIASPSDLAEEREAATEAIKNMLWPWSCRSTNFLPELRSCSIFVLTAPSRRRSPGRSSVFEQRRFGRRNRGARGPDGKNGVRPEMAPQQVEKIEFAPGNGRGSEAENPQDVVSGRAADRARPARMTRLQKVAEKAAQGFEIARCKTEIGACRRRRRRASSLARDRPRVRGRRLLRTPGGAAKIWST